MSYKPELYYWDIRGLGQPIRLLLEYTGTDFEDKYLEVGPASNYGDCYWFNNKNTLGLDFPNLPYYVDGDVKITQSNAILRYIARKHNLCGGTEEEKIRIDLIENQISDLRSGFIRLCYSPDYDSLISDYLKNLPPALELLSKFLGDRKFIAGDKITFVDFMSYELLDYYKMFAPDFLKATPSLDAYVDRIEALESIKAYIASPRYMKNPVFNRMAKWGSK